VGYAASLTIRLCELPKLSRPLLRMDSQVRAIGIAPPVLSGMLLQLDHPIEPNPMRHPLHLRCLCESIVDSLVPLLRLYGACVACARIVYAQAFHLYPPTPHRGVSVSFS